MTIMSWEFESPSLHIHQPVIAAIAQLVEHDLAKVGVASSSLVCRSSFITSRKRVSEVRLHGSLFLCPKAKGLYSAGESTLGSRR